jgi:hypothetical protein
VTVFTPCRPDSGNTVVEITMRNRTCLFIATSLLAALAAQAGDIYRWKDSNGLWHYADQPVPGAERVASTSHGVTPRSENAPPAAAASAPRATPATAQPNETTQKVREDLAKSNANKCPDAKAAYEQSLTARRLFRQGANGEPEYLNDEEVEAARVAARANMEYYCGK